MQTRTLEEWRTLFAEQAASGLSARQFCAQRSLCPKYFSLRRRQLSDMAPAAFVRVQKVVPVAVPETITTVVLHHGRSEMELRAISPEWLSRLLVALA
jgi:hypothetical protein